MTMKRRIGFKSGFSLPELSIVMLLTTIITGVLVLFYSQSRLALERGVTKTELSQRTRLAAIRIIPKLTSVISRPPTPDDPDGERPIVSPAIPPDPFTDPGVLQIELNTTKEFIKTQLRVPLVAGDEYNPRGNPTDEHGVLILRFEPKGTHPELGEFGDVVMNARPPDDVAEDIVLATNLSFVRFSVQSNDRIRLRVGARGRIKNATSGYSVDENVYETDVYLPVYTEGTD